MELSEEEQQLIEVLREWAGDDEYHLEIKREQGAWEIELSALSFGGERTEKSVRGVGKTFGEAWANMDLLGD